MAVVDGSSLLLRAVGAVWEWVECCKIPSPAVTAENGRVEVGLFPRRAGPKAVVLL